LAKVGRTYGMVDNLEALALLAKHSQSTTYLGRYSLNNKIPRSEKRKAQCRPTHDLDIVRLDR
jgi:hypothetical protein